MTININGVRGSVTTTDPEMTYYGGNTTCVDMVEDGWQLVLDGGSGIQKFRLNPGLKNRRIDILLTHLHLDHIQGLGFFAPLFDPEMEVHIWGPASTHRSLHSRLSRYLSPPLFPVLIRDLPCKLTLHEIADSVFSIGPFTVKSSYLIHPGPTVGYRISSPSGVFAFMPDHEPALGSHGMLKDPPWLSGYDLAKDADILFHDAQYTAAEYEKKRGWGHSSLNDAYLYAVLCGVKLLLLTHHDPARSDKKLDELFADFRQNTHLQMQVQLAKEGKQFHLPMPLQQPG